MQGMMLSAPIKTHPSPFITLQHVLLHSQPGLQDLTSALNLAV